MSNEILEKNLNALLENESIEDYPELAELLRTYEGTMDNAPEIGIADVAGRQVLYAVKDDKQYQLDSMYDMEHMLETWFGQMENINFQSRFILFGFGNGMFVRKILQSAEGTVKILIYEPSLEILHTVMESMDLSDILRDKRVYLVVKDIGGFKFQDILWANMKYEDIAGMCEKAYLNYPEIFAEDYRKFRDMVVLCFNNIYAQKNVWEYMGRDYCYNIIHNAVYLTESNSIQSLERVLSKDIPAIIVAAGPSLDKNIHFIKKAKNKSFIIAADSAVKALMKAGIKPDAMATIDGRKNPKHFEDKNIQDIPLITNLIANRFALRKHVGKKLFMNDLNSHTEHFLHQVDILLPIIVSGGSVATDIFALLERLQIKNVILVGLDLAYTNGRSHSFNTIKGELNEDMSQQWTQMTESIDGELIKSSTEFMIYKDWFEREIELNPNITVIDATEGGAKIKGTIIKTLEEAIAEECFKEVDMDAVMNSLQPLMNREQRIGFCEYMHQLPEDLRKIKNLVKKALHKYKKMKQLAMQDKYNTKELKHLYLDAKKIGEMIEAAPAYYYPDVLMQTEVSKILEDIYETEADERIEVLSAVDKAFSYYQIMDTILENMIPDIEFHLYCLNKIWKQSLK